MYDVTKMVRVRVFCCDDGLISVPQLLTSSPLDRLDRLARMELKKTGWFERTCVLPRPVCLSLNWFVVVTSGAWWKWVCKGQHCP